MFQDISSESVWDQDEADYFSREDGIVRLRRSWGSYNNFVFVPDQFEMISVTDSFALPTAPSASIKGDGRIIPQLREAVSYGLVELACSKGSKLSSDRYAGHDGKLVVRMWLMEEHDMTSNSGLQYVLSQASLFAGRVLVLLWGSLPCALGSPRQQLSRHRASWPARYEYLNNQLTALHDNFMVLAVHIAAHKAGHVCYERPG